MSSIGEFYYLEMFSEKGNEWQFVYQFRYPNLVHNKNGYNDLLYRKIDYKKKGTG